MKSQRNRKSLHNYKSVHKINVHTIMDKVVLAERFSQDPLESYFCKQPPGVWKDKLPLYEFGYANTFRNQKVFKPTATGKVRDEINFESDRTSSMSEKIQTKNTRCYLQNFQAASRYLAIKPTQEVS